MQLLFNRFQISLISVILIFMASCSSKPELQLLEQKQLLDFPSGSAIELYKDHVCIAGDDAASLWIGNRSFEKTGEFILIDSMQGRIPKAIKHDIEAATIYEDELLLLGSGSLAPFRNKAWLVDPFTSRKQMVNLDTFYGRLQTLMIETLNIEGVTSIKSGFVLANRGNKGYPKNHLIFTGKDFLFNQEKTALHLTLVAGTEDTSVFNGISGLAYLEKRDQLLMTVTTEDTYSNTGDGAIGKSYLWLVDDISKQSKDKSIKPDHIIDLDQIDPRFKGHKIESVCILEEKEEELTLLLVADDDDGASVLFRVKLTY